MGSCCAGSYPFGQVKALPSSLPVVDVQVGGRWSKALVDTGCSTTVMSTRVAGKCEGVDYRLMTVGGDEIRCEGMKEVKLTIRGDVLTVNVIVLEKLIGGIDVVMGMDVIVRLGGIRVVGGRVPVMFGKEADKVVRSGERQCAMTVGVDTEGKPVKATKVEIERGIHTNAVLPKIGNEELKGVNSCIIKDKDFVAEFDGEKWEVEWFWKGESPVLKNRVSCYEHGLEGDVRDKFDEEVDRWIDEGILMPWGEEVVDGVLPLMAVIQPTKNKVRPVLDFRELNNYVMLHTGDNITDVCGETLRQWRQMRGAGTIVDLKSAYLQIHVAKKLWKYQLVKHKGKTYCLTRLGFGLNSAPRIMATILKAVLGKERKIKEATNSYMDDILVNETVASAAKVVAHLARYGLAAKPPEPLDGGAALGLKLKAGEAGDLMFMRGNELPEVGEELSRRELFSVCGRLVGHYPIAGWLRVACSYIKRRAEGIRWEDKVGLETVKMIRDVLERVNREDPVKGRWQAPRTTKGVVWCDASSIATGVVLEMDGVDVEDAAWLRKKGDHGHINVAELDAVLKGVNLALKWGLQEIEVRTDSATVLGWLKSVTTAERRVRTKGASEMIVKRRLGILQELIDECGLKLYAVFVPSEKNKADALTRVKRAWLGVLQEEETEACCVGMPNVKELHQMHHMGIDRTLYVARKVDPGVTRDKVKQVVRHCERCQSIDPAPIVHEVGEISVDGNWKRLAVDVTHYRHKLFLSMVDCGPGRIAIWKELRADNGEEIARMLNDIFLERGPVDEVLMDNSTAFRSQGLKNVLDRWNVRRYFRAAYRPSGNGIVERHHRTIKAMAERGQMTPMEAVFWYNMSPRSGQDESTVPQAAVFRYVWRHPSKEPADFEGGSVEGPASIRVGDEAWVKPPDAKCTSQWRKGVVTAVHSRNNIGVDGMPRHVLDIRPVIQEDSDERETDGENETSVGPRRSQRERRQPVWMRDYEGGSEGEN